jgi:cell division septal protein FtsQ
MAPPDPEPGLARIRRGWLAAGALLVALAYAALHTSAFMVRRLDVTGLMQLSRSQVAAAAGILPGTYLWQVRPWTVARRLQAMPLLRSVHVRLLWPNAIAIAVSERQPVVLLDVGESADLEVDANERVIGLAAPPGQAATGALLPTPHVPVVHGLTAAAGARPGQVLTDPALRDAIEVAQGLGVQGQALLGSLSVDANGNVTAQLASGLQVRFGHGSQARQKTQILLGLLHVIAARNLRVDEIDVSSTTAPSVHVMTAPPPHTTVVQAAVPPGTTPPAPAVKGGAYAPAAKATSTPSTKPTGKTTATTSPPS